MMQNNAQIKYNTKERAEQILKNIDTSFMSISIIKTIQNSSYFFLATSSKDAEANLNFKGGEKGFVHVVDNRTLLFPDYDGNGILHGINDMIENPRVALLFINFVTDVRYKIKGKVTIIDKVEDMREYLDLKGFDYAPRIIKVDVDYVLGNCSKYIENVRREILLLRKFLK